METMTSSVAWTSGMAFQADLEGFAFTLDALPESGGQASGPRPKGLVLTALAGCTAMDVVSILAKMRVPLEGFRVEVEAPLTEEHPKVFGAVKVRYVFKGKDLPMDKLERAVQLSEERYCGVSAMLRKAAPITSEIRVEG
ncbi:MAG: OsmC family protein [Acidobacteria bacterium]|nr:OsmC family protein [Acidobacteriota bacterium]